MLLNAPNNSVMLSQHPLPPSHYFSDNGGRGPVPTKIAPTVVPKKRMGAVKTDEPVKKMKTTATAGTARVGSSRDLASMAASSAVLDVAPAITASAPEDNGGNSVSV